MSFRGAVERPGPKDLQRLVNEYALREDLALFGQSSRSVRPSTCSLILLSEEFRSHMAPSGE
jgi:hypothetical protein